MGRGRLAGADATQYLLDFHGVVALAGEEIIGSTDATLHPEDRGLVSRSQARVDRLCEHGVDADRSQERRLARHVRPGNQRTATRLEPDAVGNGLEHQWVVNVLEGRPRTASGER